MGHMSPCRSGAKRFPNRAVFVCWVFRRCLGEVFGRRCPIMTLIGDHTPCLYSYGFRPERSQHEAIRQYQECVNLLRYVVDLDISKFFDRVNHDRLLYSPGDSDKGQAGVETHPQFSDIRGDPWRSPSRQKKGPATRSGLHRFDLISCLMNLIKSLKSWHFASSVVAMTLSFSVAKANGGKTVIKACVALSKENATEDKPG